jgi:hypothetical protein
LGQAFPSIMGLHGAAGGMQEHAIAPCHILDIMLSAELSRGSNRMALTKAISQTQ